MNHRYVLNFLAKLTHTVTPVANQRVASALVLNGDIVAVGVNQNKSSPLQARYCKHPEAILTHAEIDAIHKAVQRRFDTDTISNMSLYIARTLKSGEWGLAKPCTGCTRAIAQFNIRRVFWTDYNGKIGGSV